MPKHVRMNVAKPSQLGDLGQEMADGPHRIDLTRFIAEHQCTFDLPTLQLQRFAGIPGERQFADRRIGLWRIEAANAGVAPLHA